MPKRSKIKFSFLFLTIILFSFSNIYSQTTVINDALSGKSSAGTKVGGTFTSEGYAPGRGTNHILYDVPKQIANGYIEFQMKGFNPSSVPKDEDNGFLAIYDGRGISEPIGYSNDFKQNYFRWNVHWRQNKNAFKAVLACAAPVSSRINSSKAVFTDKNGDGLDSHDRDWYSEPTGSGQSWNTSSWYTIKVQWNNKKFEVFVNGVRKWSTSGPYDYNPVDLKIWLGSAPGKYDADVNVTYRNFKLVDLDGSSTTTKSLAVSPSNRSVGSSSGSTTFAVTSNVSWSVSDNAAWLSVSPNSGSNGATLKASYSANTSSNSRSATITTTGGGKTSTVVVTQSGVSSTKNSLAVSPSNSSVGSSSGSTTFAVTSNVSWTVSDNAAWVTVSPTSGSNGSTLKATYSANTSSQSRTATITTSGGGLSKTVTLTQSGVVSSGGSFSVSPTSKELGNSAGDFTLNITTNGSWRVRDDTDWLSKTPKTGDGNGTSKIEFKANTTGAARTGIISVTVGNEVKEIVVTQNASSTTKSLAVSPSNSSVGSSSGSTTFAVTSNVSWTVSDNAAWVTVSPTSGSNGSTLKATYSANTSSQSRTATITTSGGGLSKTVTLTQSGVASSGGSFSVSPTSKEIGNSAGNFTLNITTNGSWRVRDNTDWMSKTPKIGDGNGTSKIEFKANTTGATRTGIISVTVGNEVREIVVTQGTFSSGSGGSISFSPSIVSLGAASGSFQLNISTTGSWRLRDNTDWLSKKPKTGNGNGNSLIIYKANTSGIERKGIITVTVGNEVKEIPVTQSASGQLSVASGTSEKENILLKSNQEDVKVEIPKSYALSQNYPNPFNPSTVITFSLPKSDNVKLEVFNLLGEKIVTLVNKNLSAGYYNFNFDASKLAAGTYIYSVKTSDFVESKKMILLK